MEMIQSSQRGSLLPFGGKVTADDARGVLRVEGDADAVREVRRLVQLVDRERERLRVRLQVRSPQDRLDYEVTARLYEGQMWRSSDGMLGITVAMTPRIDVDGTATFRLLVIHEGGSQEMTLRLRAGKEYPITLGAKQSLSIQATDKGEITGSSLKASPAPQISLRFERVK